MCGGPYLIADERIYLRTCCRASVRSVAECGSLFSIGSLVFAQRIAMQVLGEDEIVTAVAAPALLPRMEVPAAENFDLPPCPLEVVDVLPCPLG